MLIDREWFAIHTTSQSQTNVTCTYGQDSQGRARMVVNLLDTTNKASVCLTRPTQTWSCYAFLGNEEEEKAEMTEEEEELEEEDEEEKEDQ